MNADHRGTTMKVKVICSLLGKEVYRTELAAASLDEINAQLAELSGKKIVPGWDVIFCSLNLCHEQSA